MPHLCRLFWFVRTILAPPYTGLPVTLRARYRAARWTLVAPVYWLSCDYRKQLTLHRATDLLYDRYRRGGEHGAPLHVSIRAATPLTPVAEQYHRDKTGGLHWRLAGRVFCFLNRLRARKALRWAVIVPDRLVSFSYSFW